MLIAKQERRWPRECLANTVRSIGRIAVFENRRPGGRGRSAAEGPGGAGTRGRGGAAALPGNENCRRREAEHDYSTRDAAAFSGDCRWRAAPRRALLLRG